MGQQVTRLIGNEIETVDFTSDINRDSAVVSIERAEVTELPSEITKMKQIRALIINNCKNLKRLPENIGDMENLDTISIRDCLSLKTIPRSIGRLRKLKSLVLYDTGVEGLPDTVGELNRLEKLSVIDCPNFEYLPDSICDIRGPIIKNELNISITGTKLSRIPDKIADIKYISSLNLYNNKIDKLPYKVFMEGASIKFINLSNNMGEIANLSGNILISDVKEKMTTDEWKEIEFGNEDTRAEMIVMIEEMLNESEIEY